MTLVHCDRLRRNCVKKSYGVTWCDRAYSREVYGLRRRTRPTCDECFVAMVGARP